MKILLISFVGVLFLGNAVSLVTTEDQEWGKEEGGILFSGSGSGSGSGDDEGCKYTQCNGRGHCIAAYEVEYCECEEGFTGVQCEFLKGKCEENTCMNGGKCISDANEVLSCFCKEGYDGQHCEIEDASAVCPMPGENDYFFFPKCTVKTTVNKFASCLIQADVEDCGYGVVKAFRCINDVVSSCSGLECPSIWDSPKFVEFFQTYWAPAFYLANSAFRTTVWQKLCLNMTGDISFGNFTDTFGLCEANVLETMFITLENYGKMAYDSPDFMTACSHIETMKQNVHEQISGSCNFSKLSTVPEMSEEGGHLQKILEAAKSALADLSLPMCQQFTGECQYTECANGGKCMKHYGFEYCKCLNGTTGERCQLQTGSCEAELLCSEGGSCFESNGVPTCICFPGHRGERCEIPDASIMCPDVTEDEEDAMFFPSCTLKTTMGKAAMCIEEQLPFLEYGNTYACSAKLARAARCLNDIVTDCSGLFCDSVFSVPGFQEFFNAEWVPAMYNPFSDFRMGLYRQMCLLEDVDYNFPIHNDTLGLCQDDIMKKLFKIVGESSKMVAQSMDLFTICSKLEMTKHAIYNHVEKNCDFSKLDAAGLEDGVAEKTKKAFRLAKASFSEWVIQPCQMSECRYTHCKNGGSCSRLHDGMEFCSCMNGYIGEQCEFMTGQCGVDLMCMNGGSCYDSNDAISCICSPGYSGMRCEMMDNMNQCPQPADDDIIFLPTCTLKTTMGHVAMCVQKHLPSLGDTNVDTCRGGLTNAVRCLTQVITNCSRTHCDSVFSIPEFERIFQMHLAPQLYNPHSEFRIMLFSKVCSPEPGIPDFLGFDLLKQVCGAELIPGIMGIVEELYHDIFNAMDTPSMCRSIDTLKQRLIGHLSGRCDLSKLIGFMSPDLAEGVGKAVHVALDYFTDMIVPQCQNMDQSCRPITAASSQCEMAEAWACEFWNYGKSMIAWRASFMEWWAGCDGFATRNWMQWAQHMGFMKGRGMRPGQMNNFDQAQGQLHSYGKDGFIAMVKANIQCPEPMYLNCGTGEMRMFEDDLGCMWPYCSNGKIGNSKQLFSMWVTARKTHEALSKIYTHVVGECSSSSSGFSGCDVESGSGSGSGMPPFPGSGSGFGSGSGMPPFPGSGSGSGSGFGTPPFPRGILPGNSANDNQ